MAFNKSLAGYFNDVQHIGIPTDDMAKTIAFWEKLGFKKLGEFDTDDQGNEVVFMQYGHLTLEIWTGDGAVHETGAINHISLNTSDADAAFKAAKAEGFKLKDNEVQHSPTWHRRRWMTVYLKSCWCAAPPACSICRPR